MSEVIHAIQLDQIMSLWNNDEEQSYGMIIVKEALLVDSN